MVKEMFKKIIFLVSIIFFMSFVSASFTSGILNHSIEQSYGPGDNVKGWINISLVNEPSTSMIKGLIEDKSIENSISIFDLIKRSSNSNFDYTCNPVDCSSDYTSDNGQSSKTFSLNDRESTLVGFKITSNKLISSIYSFSVKVAGSNTFESTNLPLSIDVLNDGEIDWKDSSPSGNFNQKVHGCYVDNANLAQTGIITTQYCEKVTLSQSPLVEIGANVIGSGDVPFTMSIEEVEGGAKKTCAVTASQSGEIKCSPSNFPIENKDYFVCIKATKSADVNKYKIKYEQTNPCGFSDDYSGTYDYDFDIFAQTAMYSPVGEINLGTLGIEDDIMNYISERYDSNCSGGCIIPMKFNSGVTQQIDLTEPSLSYVAGVSVSENTLYNLQEIPPRLSSTFQKLSLDEAGFSVPDNYGNYTFSLKFNDNNLFSDKIVVGEIPKIKFLTPLETAANYETKFKVYTNWSSDIIQYNWDFGDGNNQTTETDEAIHSYDIDGDYNVEVKISDAKGRSSSRIFNVKVLPASEIVPVLLNQTEINIKNIKSQFNNFSVFEQKSLTNYFKLDDLDDKISNFSYSLSKSTLTEEDYRTMFGQLSAITIPKSVKKTASGIGILFYPQTQNIDLVALSKITGEEYAGENEESYKNAVLVWQEENIGTAMNYGEISANYGNYESPILKTFDITITKKGTEAGEGYIVIRKMENLFFDQDYSQVDSGDYYYIPLDTQEKEIIFSTSEDVDFETLPLFISPNISELSLIGGAITPFETNSKKWIIFGVVVGLILLVTAVVWVMLKLWYKRKYENYLFKNRNNLLNMINYIDGEKKKGTSEREILEKLRKAGWNSEQIKYALKRYSGKKII
jgi:hypothetical protein